MTQLKIKAKIEATLYWDVHDDITKSEKLQEFKENLTDFMDQASEEVSYDLEVKKVKRHKCSCFKCKI